MTDDLLTNQLTETQIGWENNKVTISFVLPTVEAARNLVEALVKTLDEEGEANLKMSGANVGKVQIQ